VSASRWLTALAAAWFAGPPAVHAAPAHGAGAAVARLEATYQPIAKLAGPARVNRACIDGDPLHAAVAGLPKQPPTGASIDGDTWKASAGGLALAVANFVAACRAPDRKIRHISGEVETAEDLLDHVDAGVTEVLDQARPRSVPQAAKRFQATLQRVQQAPGAKQTCQRLAELAKLLGELGEPPPHTNIQSWDQAHAAIGQQLDALNRYRCQKSPGAPEEIADTITQIHDGFTRLVLSLPPS
jgi:hypothetical protein